MFRDSRYLRSTWLCGVRAELLLPELDKALDTVAFVGRDRTPLSLLRLGVGATAGLSSESMDEERRFNAVC